MKLLVLFLAPGHLGNGLLGLVAESPLRMDWPTLFGMGYVLTWLLAVVIAFRPQVRFLRAWRGCAILLSMGLSMLLASRLSGGSLDDQGVLHEPFFLVGLGSLLSLGGLGFALLLVLFNLGGRIVAHLTRG